MKKKLLKRIEALLLEYKELLQGLSGKKHIEYKELSDLLSEVKKEIRDAD